MLRLAALALLAAPVVCPAVEVATGNMLGETYHPRWFYVRENPRAAWTPTYTGPKYRAQVAGRLMNLRIAQGLFDDEWLTEAPFDPEANTDRLIAALDTYREHGILAINVSLQGGSSYGPEVPEIQRDRAAGLGPGKGSLISAFLPDGSLKPAWMARLLRLQRALDDRGMILVLMYFYQGRDEVLRDPEAIQNAAIKATDWLANNDCRNVVIDVANEHDHPGWDHDRWIPRRTGDLIELIRGRFPPGFRLPIGSSTGGSMAVFDQVRDHADLTVIHGNGRSPEEKQSRVAELYADPKMPGPIYMNEDDNGRETTSAHLALEYASADAVVESGGSWGYMPWRQVQMFPFRFYLPTSGTKHDDALPTDARDQAYFRAVLEHIRGIVFQ